MTIKDILKSGDEVMIKSFFAFNSTHSDAAVATKFQAWARHLFSKYFSSLDAPFHKDMDEFNIAVYRGKMDALVNIGFRGCAKTARTKLFMAFCILNDQDHYRRYIKVLAEDGINSKQIVTDIYNMLVAPVFSLYPETFERGTTKREERMDSFTTTKGIKIVAGTVGTDQRGAIQEDARPDLIWYEDFENRTTLRSGRKTQSIWENMEEARTGLAVNGGCIYTCNYISEQGNVHTLVTRTSARRKVLITPILDPQTGRSAWPARYTLADIEQMKLDDDDFEGERLCKPSAAREVFFDREALEKQVPKTPLRVIADFKLFKTYDPSHRYASGHDVAGGVGLDSSTSVFIDFDTVPCQVVGTFKSNAIKPDTFGDEIQRETDIFGQCLAAPEKNNHGHATIARCKQLEVNLFNTPGKDTKMEAGFVSATGFNNGPKEYGWHTNAASKPKMLFAFGKAVTDGLIELNDTDLIAEAKAYTRNDLMDEEKDPRLTTRHFDLLIAACIAWQMRDYAELPETEEAEEEEIEPPLYPDIG